MSEAWAIIVTVIILMVIYAYISSKLTERKKRKLRAKTIPQVTETLKTGVSYNVFLSDGRSFKKIEILGGVEGEDAGFSFANWDGMLVLKKENNKKVYIKMSSVRFVEEV